MSEEFLVKKILPEGKPPKPPNLFKFGRLVFSNRKLLVGIVLVLGFAIVGGIGSMHLPYDPIKFNIIEKFQTPSTRHWFGTDNYGRDIFSRVVMGTPMTMVLGISAVFITLIISVPLGLFTGFRGGNVDEALMRINDTFIAIPSLFMALLLISARASLEQYFKIPTAWWFDPYPIIAIGLTMAPRATRVIRSAAINLKNEEFVMAAVARGESAIYIIFSEILPNVWPTILVEGGIRISYAIIMGATLSFLGLGASPPAPAWGLMIYESKNYLYSSPWPLIFPSVALSFMIVSFNVLGDGLRDILDPRTRRASLLE
jgi:peptide/nickel transport system permease protein